MAKGEVKPVMKATEEGLSAFVRFFGASPYIRVLDFFLTYPKFDYSKSQVAVETGVSRVTLDKIWGTLLEYELIRLNRRMGRAELYVLNTQNPKVKMLIQWDYQLSLDLADSLKPHASRGLVTTVA